MTQPTLVNLHRNEYIEGLWYYAFVVNLDIFMGICNTLNDLSNKIFVPNKTAHLDLSAFNMITGINESKILTKHMSCEFKCKFDNRKSNSNKKRKMLNVYVSTKIQKNIMHMKKIILGILLHVAKNGEYLVSSIDDSIITNDKIINDADSVSTTITSTVSTNFHNKKVRCKMDWYVLHAVLLLIILLFIIAIIC